MLDFFSQPAFLRAALGVTLAAVSCSIVGVLLINMKLSFLGVCMSHSAFAGVLLGLLLGLNPILFAFIVTLVTAGLLGPISDRGKLAPDTAVGILFSSSLGVAFIIMNFLPVSNSEALGYLWGSVLTITNNSIWGLVVVTILVLLALIIFYRYVVIVIFDRTLARSLGVPSTAIFYGIIICCGLVTTMSLGIIGGLLVFSLILNPAAAAYQLTYSIRTMFILAVIIGILSGLLGITAAWIFDLPIGASVVISSTLFYLLSYMLSIKKHF